MKDDLPFITLVVAYQGAEIEIPNVLVDTGSASTILSADLMRQIGLIPQSDDTLYTIRGVGGTEVVFVRQVDYVQFGQQQLNQFQLEIGGMDYGFEINGILGMDGLLQAGVIINLRDMKLEFVE